MTYQTFNISLPKDLVSAMDAQARQEYRNRSDLIREAVRVYLNDMSAWSSLFAYGKKQAKAKDIRSEIDVADLVTAHRKGK
jgi:metal-responsive CopG/Arc/MetJ family transcriptional regulator